MILKEKIPIDKGWSGDRKYCVTDGQGCKYLLRISPAEQYARKKRQYELMQQVAELEIPMCAPVEFGICEEGAYSIQRWIEGVDAEEALKTMPEAQQYAYGMDAGRILRKIHSIPAPADLEDWEVRFNRKMDRKIQMHSECPLKYENGQAFIDFIRENRHLLRSRPQTYQHGDYHVGNMMIGTDGVLYIIDFDRDDFGDPWEEFNRIVWCAQAAPSFATGMVDGYFDGAVPMEFWKLLALYIASNSLSSLPWAIPFGEGEIAVMRQQAQEILDWYDNMTCVVPKWYQHHRIRCVWEHKGNDTLLYAVDFPGAFTRGENLEIAKAQMPREIRAYAAWCSLDVGAVDNIEILQDAACDLEVRDADSDVLFEAEKLPMTMAEYQKLKAVALKSAADFLALYETIPDKHKGIASPRKTFYGQVPRTAEEMYQHTKSVNAYYFGEIDVEADNDGTILECRQRGFETLEKQPDFLRNPIIEGSYGESWTLRKVLRRFIWHDRIHAKAMYKMAVQIWGADRIPNLFC